MIFIHNADGAIISASICSTETATVKGEPAAVILRRYMKETGNVIIR